MGAVAIERIVVQASPEDKDAIVAKADRLGLSISELMRRGAAAYETIEANEELSMLADRVNLMAHRVSVSINDVLKFIDESNVRINVMEAAAEHREEF